MQWKRTPLQTLMQQMYDEREDADAAMWSYRDFRTASPDVLLDNAMEVVGYQCLKMGDVKTALAILQQNAAEYPGSAGAAFGLGRAWRAAGEPAKAAAELRRALAIDPRYKRAADVLAQIEAAGAPPK